MRLAKSLRRVAANGTRASALLGVRLRALREQKGLSQGDLEQLSGLLRCYISSVEHSHTVPSIDTLERMARALEVPIYSLFDEELGAEGTPKLPLVRNAEPGAGHGSEEDRRYLRLLWRQIHHLDEQRRSLLLFMARRMARASKKARVA